MRRQRGRRLKESRSNFKYLIYLSVGVLLVVVVTFVVTLISYNNKMKNSASNLLSLQKVNELVPNEAESINNTLEEASSQIGKTIGEAINNMENGNNISEKSTSAPVENATKNNTNTTSSNPVSEKPKDPEFTKPLKGDILTGYSKDNLVYSNTLQEWIVHLGIDIKAKRATVVKAAENGTVTAIKNDPRYGLTIVVEHVNGFKTIYSNLLTTEFVTEGEMVKKGQSLGTVGNSAAFEIMDEPHLHFEILKDNVNVDPNIYLK